MAEFRVVDGALDASVQVGSIPRDKRTRIALDEANRNGKSGMGNLEWLSFVGGELRSFDQRRFRLK